MSVLSILQTEKSFVLQEKSVFTLSLSKSSKLNKIELFKALKSIGITPLKINKISSYIKNKKRGKNWNIKGQKRPNKFLVFLSNNQVLDEEKITQINQLLIKTK
jgi:hypothetical protein